MLRWRRTDSHGSGWSLAPKRGTWTRQTRRSRESRAATTLWEGESESAVICTQKPGEIMIVPTTWWHATCNSGEFTFGIGGQDSCGMRDCTPPGPHDETAMERHMRMKFCKDANLDAFCFGPAPRSEMENKTLTRVQWVPDDGV